MPRAHNCCSSLHILPALPTESVQALVDPMGAFASANG